MAEIKRKKKTTTKTTRKEQTQYVGQSKTAIKPVVTPINPVAPQTGVTAAPKITPQTPPSPNPSQPKTLPEAQNKTGVDIDTPAPVPTPPPPPSALDSSPAVAPTPPPTPSSAAAPSPTSSPDVSPSAPSTPDSSLESPETPQPPENPQKSAYNQKIEEELKNKPKVDVGAKDKAADAIKDKAKKTGTKEVEQAAARRFSKDAMKQGAKVAAKAVGAALKAATTYLVGLVGWPVLAGCAAIFLILMMIFLGLACSAANGYFGKTYPAPAKSDSIEVKDIKNLNATKAGGLSGVSNSAGFHKFDYLDNVDKAFVEEGQADARLLIALKYLSQKHNRIGVSHINSGYKDMPTNPEAGIERDPQLVSNVSAHKDGLAADISQIDFVYKAKEVATTPCTSLSVGDILGGLTGGLTGGNVVQLDIVYYDDEGGELLRQSCKGGAVGADNQPSKEAIPIKVSWQDTKPEITHVGNEPDDSLTIEEEVYTKVYQPQARKKTNQVIAELLQFPYDMDNENKFKVTQLITYSYERDIYPFSEISDKLYGASRPANYGLFAMPESWAQVHVAY